MSSSSIIKGAHGPEYRCFDFNDIGAGSSPTQHRRQNKNSQADAQSGSKRQETVQQSVERLQRELQDQLLEMDDRARKAEEEGYEKGFARGKAEGLEQARQEMAAMSERFENLLQDLGRMRGRVLSDYRDWLVEAGLTIARQVVQNEIEAKPELMLSSIEAALHEARDDPSLTLHLNPKDLSVLQEHLASGEFDGMGKSFALRADSEMERGSCRLESDIQLLDCSLDTRFQLIREKLKAEQGVDEFELPE